MTVTVLLDSMEKVNSFVALARSKAYDVDLLSGKYVVNGKSIMGIFSLDLTRPITLQTADDDGFAAQLAPFLPPKNE